jgi:FAD/FMN-containing dehydrogenase
LRWASNSGVTVYGPNDKGFEEFNKPFNHRIIPKPSFIAIPKDANEISSLLRAAEMANLKVAACCGRHSYASYGMGGGDGALVIDLREFNNIHVDSNGIATIGAGNRLGQVSQKLAESGSGRAIPHGLCPEFVSRISKHKGLDSDNLIV